MAHELEEVFSWFEAGEAADYRTGVLLLQEHCRNRGLVNNLLKKESATNREKLVYELVKAGCGGRLEDVSEVLNHFAQAVQGAVQQVATVLVEAHSPVPALPEQPAPADVPEAVRPQVDELTQLMSKLHCQRCQLSNSLATLDPADGPRVVGEILTLQNQYNALSEKRRRVVAGEQPAPAAPPAPGEQPAPEGAPPAAPDRAELVKQRQNLRSNISKARTKAKEAKTEAKRSEYEQKAGRLEVELGTVEMQLALPQA